ncbi:hypothetical protein FBUS_07553 [Fasciolopsis buskii]|uniref:Uncharacterized protein n=1 Tax=Fasciolopsis buskii TaxID=27845 RepID=A0A8E0RVS0_9TREM|nr:hypothetical protein FBUS_07553 [Fasciolopsis buski]
MGSGVGVVVGLVRVVTAYDQFVRSHQLTAWRTPEMAKRRAADYTVLRAMTFGLSVGLKTTILAGGCL